VLKPGLTCFSCFSWKQLAVAYLKICHCHCFVSKCTPCFISNA